MFPRIKRSALQTVDGGPFKGKRLQKMKSSLHRLGSSRYCWAMHRIRNLFERLRCFLNSLDLSVCKDQAIDTSTEVATSTSTPLSRSLREEGNMQISERVFWNHSDSSENSSESPFANAIVNRCNAIVNRYVLTSSGRWWYWLLLAYPAK